MFRNHEIITVGISPSWDIVCRVDGIDWGEHANLASKHMAPAGKAMNVSKALAELNMASTAAGLWGASDYEQMLHGLADYKQLVTPRMVKVPGRTRQNITLVDTLHHREMHLRDKSGLASEESLAELAQKLLTFADKDKVFVFSGSLPDNELLDRVAEIVEKLHETGAKIVVDTSGPALRKLVETASIGLITPNIGELSELAGKQLVDDPAELTKTAKGLLDKVGTVLVSRGEKGAIAVSAEGSLAGRFNGKSQAVQHTVGCGDYLLAGFLAGLVQVGDCGFALQKGLISATARALGASSFDNSLASAISLTAL